MLVGRPGRFSAGFDLDEMTASVEGMRALVVRGARFWLRIYGLGMPTVAACTGHALAGGAITLLSCDLRIGADVPAKIGLNEVAIGLTLPKFATELARDRLTKASFTAATMGGQSTTPPAPGPASSTRWSRPTTCSTRPSPRPAAWASCAPAPTPAPRSTPGPS